MGMERRNRVAATCASCGGRIAPRQGVLESRHGAARAVHEDCRGPALGSAPRPRSRPLVEPLTFSRHRRLAAVLADHRRGVFAATLAIGVLGLTTVLAAGRISEEKGREDAFAIVDYNPTTTTTTTAAPSTTVSVPETTTAAPVEVLAEVVTRPPHPVAKAAPPSTEPEPTAPPVTAAAVPPTTTIPAAPTTTARPTTTTRPPTTTAAPTTTTAKPRTGERECSPDDHRGKCRKDGD